MFWIVSPYHHCQVGWEPNPPRPSRDYYQTTYDLSCICLLAVQESGRELLFCKMHHISWRTAHIVIVKMGALSCPKIIIILCDELSRVIFFFFPLPLVQRGGATALLVYCIQAVNKEHKADEAMCRSITPVCSMYCTCLPMHLPLDGKRSIEVDMQKQNTIHWGHRDYWTHFWYQSADLTTILCGPF